VQGLTERVARLDRGAAPAARRLRPLSRAERRRFLRLLREDQPNLPEM
jgi:hypothetical protein